MDTRITSKGQIVIPAILRKKYGITKDTRISIKDNDGSITLTPINDEYLHKLQGSFAGKGLLKFLLEERAKDRDLESK